jgi:hypothetical protein
MFRGNPCLLQQNNIRFVRMTLLPILVLKKKPFTIELSIFSSFAQAPGDFISVYDAGMHLLLPLILVVALVFGRA